MPKAKSDHSSLNAFKADLKSKAPRGLYLLHGEEVYLRDYYLGKLRELLLPPGTEAFNLKTLEGKDCDVQEILRTADCLPMMAQRTLVLVRDFDIFKLSEGDRQVLTDYFCDLPEYLCLVFLFDLIPYKPDARTKLMAAVKEHGLAVEFPRQEQGDLTDWIVRRFKATGHEIDSEQCRYLIFLCGDLMQDLTLEIGKIAAYAKARRITRQDIDAVATPQLDAVVFQLNDAISAKNYDKALSTLSDLLHMQQQPSMLLAVLARHLRQLYAARVALEERRSADDLAALWKMHPYPAGKLMTAAHRVTLSWCQQALLAAERADRAMKSTGGADADILTDLVLTLAHG